MNSADNYYPEQTECAWLACDRDGTVALFLTAAQGPIPEPVFGHQGTALDAVESQVMQLPQISATRLLVPVPSSEGYLGAARRGFFVYDWTDVHADSDQKEAYEQVAAPDSPIPLAALPRELQEAARAVIFSDLSFATSPLIDVMDFAPCRLSEFF